MIKTRMRWIVAIALGVSTAGLGGCAVRRGGGDNGGDQLSPEVQQAIDDVITQFTPVSEAFAAFFDGFAGIDYNGDGTFGDCPMVTVDLTDGVYSITMDYGDGCTNDYYGTNQASGTVTLQYDSNSRSFVLNYDMLKVAEREIDGSFELEFSSDGDARDLTGSIDLTTSSGSVSGSLDMQYGLVTHTITINSGTLALMDTNDETVSIDIAGLVIRPIANGSFIPQAGTITFEVPNTGPGPATLTIVIEFDNQSPNTREVSVTVGSAAPVTYTIPAV